MLAFQWHVGQVLWSIIWFTMFFIWIWLAISVFMDIFRSHDMSNWIKALWVIGIVLFPFLGVLIYLIARGGKMAEHRAAEIQRQNEAMQAYVQQTAGGGVSHADEIEKLAGLRDRGVITDDEFAAQKAKLIG